MDGNQVSSMLFPEKMSLPSFDVICVHFEAYPEVHLRSSALPLSYRRLRDGSDSNRWLSGYM
jgi:hypothetical protein